MFPVEISGPVGTSAKPALQFAATLHKQGRTFISHQFGISGELIN